MASGKLSPRQKMINMMYLVLLAILALNVSSEVLDAFSAIRLRLQEAATEADAHSVSFIGQMKQEIDREINREGKQTNAGLLDSLDLIRGRTLEMLRELEVHQAEMEKIADYDPELQDFRVKDEQEKNYHYWMGDNDEANERRGNGQAMQLREQLDDYFTFLAEVYNAQVKSDSFRITAYQTSDPAPTLTDADKRWEQYTFEGPVLANMASLEAIKIDLFRQEKQLLDLLNTRLGVNVFVPDTVIPISAPVSRVVPAGMQFQTQLFVGLSSKQLKPVFESSSGQIELQDNGNTAMLTIPAQGARIPQGQKEGKQTYSATIKVPKATGGFQELVLQEEFVVRKPEAVITSAAIQQLYRNCANPLTIDVPALGADYDPVITASQAQVEQSSRSRKRFQLTPRGQECLVSISTRTGGQTIPIDAIRYQVVEPPRPSIDLKVGNRSYNGTSSVPASSSFTLLVVPDPEFRRQLPEEAQYRISQVEILLKDGLEPARVVQSLNVSARDAVGGIPIRLPTEVRQARAGARVFLRMKEVARRNYRGEQFADGRFQEMDLTIPIVIRP
jgi:gliding motility-associated protein GldM